MLRIALWAAAIAAPPVLGWHESPMIGLLAGLLLLTADNVVYGSKPL